VFGLTFLHSVFLAGLAAAILPILIHLFSRRRAREVAFPSLEYLREISRQKVRRMRLRQWILLALRVLILAFFALAMGRPAIRGTAGVVTRGSSTLAIMLDNSYSMSAADPRLVGDLSHAMAPAKGSDDLSAGGAAPAEGGAPGTDSNGTVFRAARARALEILDLVGEGDRGLLVLTGRPVTFPFQTPVADAGLLRQEVRRATLSADRSDLPSALSQVLPVLASARTMNKELFIISDFQKSDLDEWIRSGSEGSAPDSAGSIRIPKGIRVYLVPVREAAEENASIERVRFNPSAAGDGGGQCVVTVLNQGEDPITDRVVRVAPATEGSTLGDALVSLPPHGRSDVNLDLRSLPADGALQIQIGSDPLEWDNRAYLVTGNSSVRKVLLVTGGDPGAGLSALGAGTVDAAVDPPGQDPGQGGAPSAVSMPGGEQQDEGRFLSAALDPEGNSEFFHVRRASPAALADAASLDADVVILSDVGRLSPNAVENLARFRARGGGILIGMGDRVDPRYYNTEILGKLGSVELLNLSQQEGDGSYRSLRPTVLAHPIFAGFPVGPGDDLGAARFYKVMTTRIGSGARVLAEFGRDVPALIEEDGLLLFTSGFEGKWNDFVTSASFPPLLHQMVRYLANRGEGDQRLGLVGGRLETLVPQGTVEGPVLCDDPSGARSPVEQTPLDQMVRLRSQPALLPGIYRFLDPAGKVLTSFAVNLDPREGDLAVATPQVEARLFGRDAHRVESGKPITRDLLQGRYGRELWRPLLVMVLLLLAVESVLGRGKLLG
jgi:hypothetical protein